MAGATKSQWLETRMLVIKLAGVVNSKSTTLVASEIKMLTIMKMAEAAEAEVEVAVAVSTTTRVAIVLSLRAASSAVRKVTFPESARTLAEAVGEAVLEVVASSVARMGIWLVTVPAVMQVAMIPRVGVVVEVELLAVAQSMLATASSARERVISRESALTTTVKAMLSPTRDRDVMRMVAPTAEEVAIMLRHLATVVVSGVTILHLHRTLVHSGEHLLTTTPMPTLTPGEILTPATITTRLRMMHGAPATTMMAAAAAGTEQ